MASPASSGSSILQQQNSPLSGCDGDHQVRMDQRKRKRMVSNRESARRSRMRKQKHLDELMSQVSQLRNENNLIINNINLATSSYLNVEAENSVLRAQMSELTHRLHSLNDIISCLNDAAHQGGGAMFSDDGNNIIIMDDFFLINNPWNSIHLMMY